MSKEFSRKDLKQQDEFLSTATQLMRWLLQRRKAIGLVLLLLVAVAAVLAGVRSYRARQEQNAAALLAVALRVYNSPIILEGEAEGAAEADEHSAAGHEHFASNTAKFEAAAAAFEPIVAEYGSNPSGRAAAFYLGASLSNLGRTEEALEALQGAARSSSPLLRAVASFRLGELYLAEARYDEALEAFAPLLDSTPTGFPAEEALAATARTHEAAGDRQAAMITYQRIVEDFPASAYAATAKTHAEELAASLGVDLGAESS